MTTRRRFIKRAAAAAGVASVTPWDQLLAAPIMRAPAPLNILILGGTGFTGPEQVDYAIARGHRVTLFNRGKTRPGVFKGKVAEELIGDLNNDTSALSGKKFDVVIDNPTTFPAWVRNAGKYLAGNVKHYIFISTTSTYSDQSIIGLNETSPVQQLPDNIDPYTIDPAMATRYYGHLKIKAEQEVAKTYPDTWTVIRPCLIVGPLDRTDRYTYWPARIDKGGEVLAPDKPDDPCQFIDSRDLAEWTVRVAEQKVFGTYNAIGPAKPITINDMLESVKAAAKSDAKFTYVPWDFLRQEGIRPWSQMTVWQPPYDRTAGYQRRDASKAIAKGLTFRPLLVTAKDTLAWHKTRPQAEQDAVLEGKAQNGLAMTREAEVLAKWHASGKG